jgi:hypothetical protein
MYVRAPVNSNMITTTETVIRMTPLEIQLNRSREYVFIQPLTSEQQQLLKRHMYPELYTVHLEHKTWKFPIFRSTCDIVGQCSARITENILFQSLDYDPYHSPKRRPYSHGWYENASRNFAPISDYYQPYTNDSCEEQRKWGAPLVRRSTKVIVINGALQNSATYWHRLWTLPPPSHSRNKMAIIAVMSRRKNRL